MEINNNGKKDRLLHFNLGDSPDQAVKAVSRDTELLSKRIRSLNADACALVEQKVYEMAIERLKEAEKILEYVAQSCKNIRKQLIIIILHNIAFVSQKSWDLETCSDYIEGIIYNHQITAEGKRCSEIQIDSQKSVMSEEHLTMDFDETIKLIEYYLQYCAINSQLFRHKNALGAVRKSLKLSLALVKCVFANHEEYFSSQKIQTGDIRERLQLLKYCMDLKDLPLSDHKKQNFMGMIWSMWLKDCSLYRKNWKQNQFKGMSIGNVMTLHYKHFVQLEHNGKKKLQKSVYYLFLVASMTYFSIATETRLLESKELEKESKNCLFLAVFVYLLLIPFESPYILYIMDYFRNENKGITVQNASKITAKQILQFLKNQEGCVLPQQSIATPQRYRRKNQRLQHQNKKLKHLIECNRVMKKNIFNKKSKDSKAKSLSMSRQCSNKLSFQGKLRNVKDNSTNMLILTNEYFDENTTPKKKDHKKTKKTQKQIDEIGQRYFEMAFKKVKSPSSRKKKEEGSLSSTKDQSACSNMKSSMKKTMMKGELLSPLKVKHKGKR